MICVVYWLFDSSCASPEIHGYIGITEHLPRRVSEHRRRFGSTFEVKVLFSGTRSECYAEERRLRPEHSIGWNLIAGGLADRIYPPSVRQKIGNGNKGKKRSTAFRENIRRKNTGRKHDPQWVANTVAILIGRPISEKTRAAFHEGRRKGQQSEVRIEACRNIEYTPELRAKLSAASKGKKRTPEHRAAIAEANKRRVISEETRAKMRAAAKARMQTRVRGSSGGRKADGEGQVFQ